jgi:hypothetical protein
VLRLLKKYSFKLLKSGSLTAKAEPKKQRPFYQEVLLALMEKAKKGAMALLSVDGAHFVMGCDYLGQIWCQTHRFIKTFLGRGRYNVLSPLALASKKLTTVTNDSL